jgi:hypothetical protein
MRENLSQRPRGDFIVELVKRGTKTDLRELLYAIRSDPLGQVLDNALGAAALCIERDNEDGFPWAARRARDFGTSSRVGDRLGRQERPRREKTRDGARSGAEHRLRTHALR